MKRGADMKRAEDGANAPTIDDVHTSNELLLRQKSVDPVAALETAAELMAGRRIAVSGECRNRHKLPRGLRFDLAVLDAEGDVRLLPTKITNTNYRRISRFLAGQHAVDLGSHIANCHEITVDGFLALDTHSGTLYLDARRVGPAVCPRGNIAVAHDSARAHLVELGVSAMRLDSDDPHHVKYTTRTVPWPDPLRSLTMITTPRSQGAEDFLRQVDTSKLDVQRTDIAMRGPAAARALIDAVTAAQAGDTSAIVLVRGGGKWPDLHIFDRLDVAERIYTSSTPVFTAIGHAGDVTLADRVATASFDTPTAAGTAIRARMGAITSQKYVERNAAAKSARESRRLSAERAHRDELEAKTRELTSLREEFARTSSECDHWMELWHNQAHRAGLLHIQLRSLVLALVATAVLCATTTALITGLVTDRWWWLLVAASLASGIFAIRGPRRALTAPAHRRTFQPMTWESWCDSAGHVSAPRRFRRLWVEGRPVNRADR